MDFTLADSVRLPKIINMVPKFDHALLHLLYQVRVGWLRTEVAAIVSNHADASPVAEHHGIPFHHWSVTRATKPECEAKLIGLAEETGAELVVLARYMQVRSDFATFAWSGYQHPSILSAELQVRQANAEPPIAAYC